MTKKLLVVFASGLVLAMVLLSLAWVAGGPRFVSDLEKKNGWTIAFDDDDDSGPRATRTLAYDGSRPLTVEAPVKLNFVRGTDAKMTVEGAQNMVSALRWEDGRLFMADTHPMVQHTLNVTITAPQIPGIVLKGASDVKLNGVAQPALAVELDGAGKIEGNGKVDRLTVVGNGAGDIDFAALDTGDATVRTAGVGNVELAATGKVDIDVAGAGNVSLHKKPRELTTRINGIGSVDHDY